MEPGGDPLGRPPPYPADMGTPARATGAWDRHAPVPTPPKVIGPPRRFRTHLVGVSFEPGYPGPLYRAALDRRHLELRREPENPVDPHAVVVTCPSLGATLGHLRSRTAAVVAPLLDDGELWIAGELELAICDGKEAAPGANVVIERVEWCEQPLGKVVRLGDERTGGGVGGAPRTPGAGPPGSPRPPRDCGSFG